MGVVGTGAIGTATIRLLLAFGCRVAAYSRTERAEVRELGVRYMPLDELMGCCDIVSLHVPLTTETHHLIDARRIALMQPTALLVNTARGAVVDTEALAKALQEALSAERRSMCMTLSRRWRPTTRCCRHRGVYVCLTWAMQQTRRLRSEPGSCLRI